MYDYNDNDESLADAIPAQLFSDDSFDREFNCYVDPNIAISHRVALESLVGFESYSL